MQRAPQFAQDREDRGASHETPHHQGYAGPLVSREGRRGCAKLKLMVSWGLGEEQGGGGKEEAQQAHF